MQVCIVSIVGRPLVKISPHGKKGLLCLQDSARRCKVPRVPMHPYISDLMQKKRGSREKRVVDRAWTNDPDLPQTSGEKKVGALSQDKKRLLSPTVRDGLSAL